MPDLLMNVDTALSEVPVNIMPLIDDTDFKSREEAVAYNAAGLELIWHFVTIDGQTSATVVTPTSGGNYDWVHQDGGMYTIEIPASGGASINNDTEGFGWFTGVATGILPWRGPIIAFRSATLNNALIAGTTKLPISDPRVLREALAQSATNSTIVLDASASANDDEYNFCRVKITEGTGAGQVRLITDYNGTSKTANVYPNWLANPQSTSTFQILDTTAVSVGGLGPQVINSGAVASTFDTRMQQAIWDVQKSSHTTAGSMGKALQDAVEANIGNLNATVSSRSSHSASDAGTDAASKVLATPANKLATDASGRVTVGDVIAAVLAKFFTLDSGTTFASAVAGSVVKEIVENVTSGGGGGGPTLTQIVEGILDGLATLKKRIDRAAGTITTYKTDGTTPRGTLKKQEVDADKVELVPQ